MGEGFGNEALIMPFVSSANIACGYHAGDENIMRHTIDLAIKHRVAIGAHPSFPGRADFGRTEMRLPLNEIHELVTRQLQLLREVLVPFQIQMRHVKPHGALYNIAARDAAIAKTVAQAVKDVDPSLVLFGLSGSHSIDEAKAIGLATASEVFADRSYQDDATLTPRSQPGAMIEDTNIAVQQVLQMITEGVVTSLHGKRITLLTQTVCIHGDSIHAPGFAEAIFQKLNENKIVIKAR